MKGPQPRTWAGAGAGQRGEEGMQSQHGLRYGATGALGSTRGTALLCVRTEAGSERGPGAGTPCCGTCCSSASASSSPPPNPQQPGPQRSAPRSRNQRSRRGKRTCTAVRTRLRTRIRTAVSTRLGMQTRTAAEVTKQMRQQAPRTARRSHQGASSGRKWRALALRRSSKTSSPPPIWPGSTASRQLPNPQAQKRPPSSHPPPPQLPPQRQPLERMRSPPRIPH